MPSPAATEVKTVNFAGALDAIMTGRKMRRESWPPGECIFLHAGILHLRKADSTLHQLIVCDVDITATDFVELL